MHHTLWLGQCFTSLVILGMMVGGCDKSSDSEGVDKAQRLVRASGQTINLSETELNQIQAGEVEGKSQQIRLAERVAERQEGRSAAEFDTTLKEIDALREKLKENDPQTQTELTGKLVALSQLVQRIDRGVFDTAEQANQRRITEAISSLRDLAATGEDPSANWMMGILHLMQARLSQGQLRQQIVNLQDRYITIGRLSERARAEHIVADGLKTQLPDEVIHNLQEHLQGNGFGGMPSLQQQWDASVKRLAELTPQKNGIQQRLDMNQTQSQQLRQEYLGLLELAGKAQGQDRFDLEQKAHDVRAEKRQNGEPGLIYYETQTELAVGELDVADANLRLEQLRQEKLSAAMEQLSISIDSLGQKDIFRKVEQGIAESQSRLSDLTKSLNEALTLLQKDDDNYQKTRSVSVGAFVEAKDQFAKAGRTWRSDAAMRKRQDNTKQMVAMIDDELVQLWRADAVHFTHAVTVAGLMENMPDIGAVAQNLRMFYEQQIRLAEESGGKLKRDETTDDTNSN